MTEYIKRDAAIEMLHYYSDESCSSVVSDFESIPAADVAPVVHGRWERRGFFWYCTCCNVGYLTIWYPTIYENIPESRYKYCPNCGAKMDE